MKMDIHVIIEQTGECKVCGKTEDLRFGACFDCADLVSGREVRLGVHDLWETNNPRNTWTVYDREIS